MITDSQLQNFYIDQYPVQSGHNKINTKLWKEILKTDPDSVFEFGCNCGKNLFNLQKSKPELEVFGCDINERSIDSAMVKGVYLGGVNELKLRADIMTSPPINKYSTSFTCSVFCHMNEIDEAIEAMKLMSKRVLLLETNDERDWNYIQHNYESYGFKKKWSIKSTPGNDCLYSLYEYITKG